MIIWCKDTTTTTKTFNYPNLKTSLKKWLNLPLIKTMMVLDLGSYYSHLVQRCSAHHLTLKVSWAGQAEIQNPYFVLYKCGYTAASWSHFGTQ